jgi:hypothetical protein
MTRLGTHAKADIRAAMRGRKGAEARALAITLAERYACSAGRIYALTADVRPGRKRRTDAGAETPLMPETERAFFHLTVAKGLSAPEAREILAEANHAVPSVSTLNRRRRRAGLAPSDVAADRNPAVRMEAEYPNRVWQMDSSGSTMFYLDADGSVFFESPLKRTKNKPEQERPKVWIVAVVDDHSRAAWAELVPANDTQSWLTAFANAARAKDADFPFCGLPEEIYSDNDSVVKSARFRRVMGLFDPPVAVRMARPYIGKRSKGKIERFIRTLKSSFEARHRAAEVPNLARIVDQDHHEPTRWRSLAEANEHLRAWLLRYNNRVHGTTAQSPFARFVAGIAAHAPRTVSAEILRGLVLLDSREAVVARDLTVAVNGTRWALPHQEPATSMVGRRITVWWSPDLADSVYADLGDLSVELHPEGAPVPYGTFRAIEMPRHERRKIEIAQDADPPVALPAPAAAAAAAPRWVGPRGTATAVRPDAAQPAEVVYGYSDALRWLVREAVFHRRVSDAEHAALRALFADRPTVDLSELRRWAREWSSGSRIAAAGGVR